MKRISIDVAKRLRRFREKSKKPLWDIAAKAKMSEASLSKIERGLTDPQMSTFLRILTALGVSWEEFGK